MTKIFTKVKPGDLITSDLFNQITDKIEETDEITSVMEVKKNSEADASKMGNLIIKSNLGVGTKDLPSEKLEVNGTVKTGNDGQFLLLKGLKGSESTMSLDFMTSNEGRGSSSIPTASFRAIDDKYFSSHLGFLTNEASQDQNKLTERLRITSKGNVGIGTTEPSEKLEVKGTVKADKFLGDGSGLTGITGGKAGQWTDIAGGISYNAGNIGIGTDKPSVKLEVNGNIKASAIESKPAVNSFKVEEDFEQFYPIIFSDKNWDDGPMVLEINRPDANTDSKNRGSLISRFTVHSTNGKNGADICHAEIYHNQDVNKEFIAGYENVPDSADFVVWLRGGNTTYSYRSNHFVTLNPSANTLLNDKHYEPKKDVESYVVKNGIHFDKGLVIDGNVGIGTTNPSEKLEVKGTVKADKFLGDGSGLTGLKEGQWASFGGGIFFEKGNVGIGTTIPENADGWSKVLDILGPIHTKLSVRTPNIDSRILSHESGFWGAPAGMIIGTNSAHSLSFGTSQTFRITIDKDGKVGIGTTTPSATLDVNGDIRINNNNIWLRGTGDNNHGIGYNGSVDGPLLFGCSGGALGTGTADGEQKIALHWNSNGNVGIGTTNPEFGLDIKASDIRLGVENNVGGQLIIKTREIASIPENISKVTLYEGRYFQGNSKELGVGDYKEGFGIGNDTLSSLKVPPGLKVMLYKDNITDIPDRTYTGDVLTLQDNFEDIVSSIKIEKDESFVPKYPKVISIQALDSDSKSGANLELIGPDRKKIPYLGLDVSDVRIYGNLSVTGHKNFSINHPLCPDTHNLVHSTLEGPETAVFYRGEAQLSNAEIGISLPDYFEALTRKENRTVLLTPKFEEEIEISMLAASEVKDGKFIVKAIDNKNPSQKFYWEVKAIRADVDLLEVEQVKTPFNSSA